MGSRATGPSGSRTAPGRGRERRRGHDGRCCATIQSDTHVLRRRGDRAVRRVRCSRRPGRSAPRDADRRLATLDCPADGSDSRRLRRLPRRSSTAWSADSSTTSSAIWPASTSAAAASWQATIALLDQPDSAWWDDVTTAGRTETRDDIIAAALDEAGRELRAAYGDPAKWTWGRLHRARFAEATLGVVRASARSSGTSTRVRSRASGAAGAVNNTYYRPSRAYPDPDDPTDEPVGVDDLFSITNLPSYRLSIDLGDLDGARIVQTTGQSGNPFDSHYGDLIDEWLVGRDGAAAVLAQGRPGRRRRHVAAGAGGRLGPARVGGGGGRAARRDVRCAPAARARRGARGAGARAARARGAGARGRRARAAGAGAARARGAARPDGAARRAAGAGAGGGARGRARGGRRAAGAGAGGGRPARSAARGPLRCAGVRRLLTRCRAVSRCA